MISDPDRAVVEWPDRPDPRLEREVHRVLAAVVELGGAIGWLHVPSPAETAAWLDGELTAVRAGTAAMAVLRRAGQVAALGLWSRFSAPVLSHGAEVRKLMVHPDARGGGLAREVMTALTARAAAAGVEVLVLHVRGNNHGAQALYTSLGWREYGRVPDLIAVGDDRWDQVSYCLDLPRPPHVRRHGSSPGGPGSTGPGATG